MIASDLAQLCESVRASTGLAHKRDIALAYRELGGVNDLCRNGDDCAAIPDGDGYSLFAIEGLLEDFVRAEPWFAGYCGVMVNLSDVAAMGGRAIAVVDALWATGDASAARICAGMRDAARAYGVPIVGGHTNVRSSGDRLAIAVLGRAHRLLTSFDARAGDVLIAAIDLRGAYFEPYAYWNCSTSAPAERLRGDLDVLATIAELGLCNAAKDISMGGVLGTLLMLLECSRLGASLSLDALPRPEGVDLARWIATFPSFGFVLAARRERACSVIRRFTERGIAAAAIGSCSAERTVHITSGEQTETLWEFAREPFMGVHVA